MFRTFAINRDLKANVSGNEIGVGSIFGFLKIITRIHRIYGGRVFIAWEGDKKNNFRLKLFPQYKKRKKELKEEDIRDLEDLNQQEKRLKAVLRSIGIRQFYALNGEADDVMEKLSSVCEKNVQSSIIYTGDSDLRQLVRGHGTPVSVTVISPGKKSVDDIYDTSKSVFDKHGVYPNQLADLKTLAGDNSDNIPGVRNVGPKTATSLIDFYSVMDNIIEEAGKRNNEWPVAERFRKIILESVDDVLLYKKLIDLRSGMEIKIKEITRKRDEKKVKDYFKLYGFTSLLIYNEFVDIMRLGAK
jgi:DNA polymerase-1